MNFFKKAKKGFTLVELVVVIAVIAILAAVSVGAYFGVTESANNSKAEQEAKQVYTQLQTKTIAGLDLGNGNTVELKKDGLLFSGLYNSDILSVMNTGIFADQGVTYDVIAATGAISSDEEVSENATLYFFGEKDNSSGNVFSKYMGYVPANLSKKYVKYMSLGTGSFVNASEINGTYSDEVLPSNMTKHTIKLDNFSDYNKVDNAYRYIGSYAVPNEVTYNAITVTNKDNIDANQIQLNAKNNAGIYITDNELGRVSHIFVDWAIGHESNNEQDSVRFWSTTYEKYEVTSKDNVTIPSTEKEVGRVSYPNKFMSVSGNNIFGRIETVKENAAYVNGITIYYTEMVIPQKVNSLVLDKTEVNAEVGTTVQINATVGPNAALDKSLTWKAEPESVATVDSNGLVTSTGVDGKVTITATSNENPTISKTCEINFKTLYTYSFGLVNNASALEDGAKILIGNRTYNTIIGDKATNANYYNVKSITDISESFEDFNATFNNLTDIDVLTLEKVNDKWALKITDGEYITYGNTSSNYLYKGALLNEDGTTNEYALWNISFDNDCNAIIENSVKAGRYIKYNKPDSRFSTYGGVSSSVFEVQMFKDTYTTSTAASAISIDGKSFLKVGVKANFNATIYPSFTTETPAITWVSSDPTVATIVDGELTAIKEGITTITATIKEGTISSNSIEVTVKPLPSNGYYSVDTVEDIEVGQKYVITGATTNIGMTKEEVPSNYYNRKGAPVTKVDNQVNFEERVNIEEFTLVSGYQEGTYAFQLEDGVSYLAAVVSGNNANIKLSNTIDEYSSRFIKFDENDGKLHIYSATDDVTKVDMRTYAGQSCFNLNTYNSTYENVLLYRLYGENTYIPHEHDFGIDNNNKVCSTCGDENPNYEAPQGTLTYTHTFESKNDAKIGSNNWSSINWTVTTDTTANMNFDGTYGRGIQFGTGNNPATYLTISSNDFANKKIISIKLNTSGASSTNANLVINIDGVQFGDDVTLTSSAAEYTFSENEAVSVGTTLSFNYTQTSKKAIYIKSIEIVYETI